jgi:hypothetical protein
VAMLSPNSNTGCVNREDIPRLPLRTPDARMRASLRSWSSRTFREYRMTSMSNVSLMRHANQLLTDDRDMVPADARHYKAHAVVDLRICELIAAIPKTWIRRDIDQNVLPLASRVSDGSHPVAIREPGVLVWQAPTFQHTRELRRFSRRSCQD